MKKYRKLLIPVAIIAAIAGAIAFALFKLSQDEVLNMADVYATIKTVSVYFIPSLVIVVAFIAALIIFRNKSKRFKFWLKWESVIALLVSILISTNVVLFGPMSSILNLNYAKINDVKESTYKKNQDLTETIANEGTVLLKNEDQMLPLQAKGQKLNVFGWGATNPVYGGTGSGNVDTSNAVDIEKSLKNADFELNESLLDFYRDYREDRPVVGMWEQDWTLPEPGAKDYKQSLIDDAKKFSDTAMITITRVGGEGADLPVDMKGKDIQYNGRKDDFEKGEHFLELSKSEKEMVDLVTSNFKNVIVLVNASNAMELGWINDYDNIKSAIWMPGAGATGFNALGKVLSGEVNPSGRTVDTFVYDLTKTPTWNNFGDFSYENSDYKLINYVEGIYVGYKYYETKYENKDEEYRKEVQYPFGYGLSYTTFDQSMSKITQKGDKLTFDVTVKNNGKTSGKEVVQIYNNPPYTNGGLEKAATNLVDFAKTKELKPGESQTIPFEIAQEELASFDTYHSGAYVLEKGQYNLQLKSNSHDTLASEAYEVKDTIVYNEDNKRPSDEKAATVKFKDFVEGEVTYLSRKDDFANYDEVTKSPAKRELTDLEKDGLTNVKTYKLENDDKDKMPTTGAKNGLVLNDLKGLDYNDKKWDQLLDQLSVKDMTKLIAHGGYQTLPVKSVGKVQTYDFDGPAGISSFFVKNSNGTAFPTATMIAATWNKELAEARGHGVGEEASQMGISGWYGPAMNIHRNAFAGRNFEYYSEDGVVSGAMAAAEIKGAMDKGVYTYMKHFALNDQETNRTDLLLTWSTEQAVREIYLKPFEDAVKKGGATAAMSAFNYIGNEWAGGSSTLLNDVLRGEWGFRGFVLTDYFGGYKYMDADKAIRNGNDAMLSTNGEMGATLDDTTSATSVKAMRTATHNILYTVANSRAYEKDVKKTPLMAWEKTTYKVNTIVIVALALLQILAIAIYRKKTKLNRL